MNWRTRLSRFMDCNTSTFGPVHDPVADKAHRMTQMEAVRCLMLDSGRWYTLRGVSNHTGIPEGSVGAVLRHFRKEPLCFQLHRRQIPHSRLWEYQLCSPLPDMQQELLR